MAVDFDAYTPFGTDNANATRVFQDEWNRLGQAFTGDGIVGERTQSDTGRITVTAAGGSTNVIVSPNGTTRCVIIAGHTGILTADKTINIDAGGAPGSGVRRLDWIVARVVRASRKIVLDVVPGDPGTGVPKALTTDRAGDCELPLALIDRTGPLNVTNAMITGTSLRPAPVWFAGSALGSTVRDALGIPDGGLLVQGNELWIAALNSGGTAMTFRPLSDPSWSNLTLPSGYSAVAAATPQYRVRSGGLELRGIIQRSGSAWVNGQVVASFPLSVNAGLSNPPSIWHRHKAAVLYPSTSTLGTTGTTPIRVVMSETGGTISLPNAANVNSTLNRLDLSVSAINP